MSSSLVPSIAPVVSLELSIFQNRQLSRLVRELRKEMNRLKASRSSVDDSGKDTGDPQGLEVIIEELKAERQNLYSRLDRCLATLSHLRASGAGTAERTPLDSSVDFVQNPDGTHANVDALQAEIVRVQTALALQRSLPGIKQKTSNSGNLSLIHTSWMLDFPNHQLEMMFSDIQKTLRITESTFLTEIERMSEDLAQRQQECRKYAAQVADLEEKLKSCRNATGPEVEVSAGHSADNDQLKSLQLTNSKLLGQLRIKEEQCSRILSQHIQLQSRSVVLGEEVERLRVACASLSESNSASQTNFENREAIEAAERDLRLSYIEASKVEASARKRLHDLVERSSGELASFNDIVVRTDNAWKKLQEDYRDCLREKTELLSSKYDSSMNRQTSNSNSFAQIELDSLKIKIRCSLCLLRNKAVALAPCLHCFCRECVDEKMLGARNRKCPLCMQRFSDAEVREIHFLKD